MARPWSWAESGARHQTAPFPNMETNEAASMLFAVFVALAWLVAFSLPILVLIIGGVIGAVQERRHFDDLAKREAALAGFPVTDLRTPPAGLQPGGGTLVSGSVVIAADHFKSFCAKWRKLVGGEFLSLSRMQERARREAILRMVEEARRMGATAVCNVRVETSTIGAKQEGKVSGCEIMVYGTALLPSSAAARIPIAGPPPIPVRGTPGSSGPPRLPGGLV